MKLRYRQLVLWMLLAVAAMAGNAGEDIVPPSLLSAKGNQYRLEMNEVLSTIGVDRIQAILKETEAGSAEHRYARILLARIQQPSVFDELGALLAEWRENSKNRASVPGERPGVLSGRLIQFLEKGPEDRFVEKHSGWSSRDLTGESGNTLTIRMPKRERVEKYSQAEVRAGIARNAAARQAVLEHFLKFLHEDSEYEQGEMVDLVHRLWGATGPRPTEDHVEDADDLIEAVFVDKSCSPTARMRAAFCLADSRPTEVQRFMLDVVTNTPTDGTGKQRQDMVNRALAYLESAADERNLQNTRQKRCE